MSYFTATKSRANQPIFKNCGSLQHKPSIILSAIYPLVNGCQDHSLMLLVFKQFFVPIEDAISLVAGSILLTEPFSLLLLGCLNAELSKKVFGYSSPQTVSLHPLQLGGQLALNKGHEAVQFNQLCSTTLHIENVERAGERGTLENDVHFAAKGTSLASVIACHRRCYYDFAAN